jgi:hypothetical protein
VFMFNRLSGPVSRIAAISVAILAFAGPALHAQTAPQLLPYTSRLIAGGGATATFTVGQTCPIAGAPNVATDVYGDGCLATEVQLSSPRYAVADANGNIFFSDYSHSLIRRVDAVTGLISAVVGGATASPAAGATCGAFTSTDARGDGCLGTAIKIGNPTGLTFDASGNLYFGDYNYSVVRKVAATGGFITTSGVVSLIDGQVAGTFGYTSNFGTTTVVAATGGYLDAPFGITFDNNGNLYIPDESKQAIVVVNTGASTTDTVTGVTIPPGTVAKIVGTVTGGGTVCPNSPASTNGCNFGLWVNGSQANSSMVDAPWAAAVDPSGNVYFTETYNTSIGVISPAGIINNFAGIQATIGKNLANTKRGAAGSFAIGASVGLTTDNLGNLYIPDLTNGLVWRVDGTSNNMYVVGGGATTVCGAAIDTFGDGCPALQATFGSTGTYESSSSTGIYGANVDTFADVFVGDAKNNLVREVASGTQFGVIGANQPTDIVEVHFAAGDTAATSGAYALTAGSSNFSLGTANCTTNSDTTTDCLLPVTATPTVLGTFTGTLQVTSKAGRVSSFPLSGIYASSPKTRTTVSAVVAACSGTNTYATTVPVTLTATLISNGPSAPTGTYNFYANGSTTPLNTTPVAVSNIGTTGAPVYGAVFTYTFATAGTYAISATFTPTAGSYYLPSASTASATVVSSAPTLTLTPSSYQQNTVTAGQTALYSFTMPSVYVGTVSFAVTGLPANSTYALSPSGTLTLSGCQTTLTYALSIYTQQQTTVQPGSFVSGRGTWSLITAFAGVVLALAIGLRRRRIRFAQLWMALALLLATSGTLACGKPVGSVLQPATPAGTYTITVTATGSAGASPAPITFQLTVH